MCSRQLRRRKSYKAGAHLMHRLAAIVRAASRNRFFALHQWSRTKAYWLLRRRVEQTDFIIRRYWYGLRRYRPDCTRLRGERLAARQEEPHPRSDRPQRPVARAGMRQPDRARGADELDRPMHPLLGMLPARGRGEDWRPLVRRPGLYRRVRSALRRVLNPYTPIVDGSRTTCTASLSHSHREIRAR